jgi:HD-like signal output (HDOD) protein
VQGSQLERELDALDGCPVIESAAATFQMTANGQPSCLNPLMDLVDKDPGLAAQMLITVNHLKKHGELDPTPVEDPRLAVGLLGELRLAALGRSLVTVEERMVAVPPLFNWSQFWMFQMGTARMAKYTCRYLEFHNLEETAYLAGLLHDLGKLLLMRLHPFAFQAALAHAREHQVPLRQAEQLFLATTTPALAAHFAEKHGLPRRFANVMRWIDTPEQATEDAELVAIVSLARDLCRHNRIGACGDTPAEKAVPLEESKEWQVLRSSVFPSFNLKKFEVQVHADCRDLKLELHGRLATYAVA